MTVARKDIVDCQEVRNYHCTSRCVRRAFLCGQDFATGKDYQHRRTWIRDRLKFLSGIFAIEVISYAVQSNHLHVILRTRPDLAEKFSDREVAYRWLQLYRPSQLAKEDSEGQTEVFIQAMLRDHERIEICRRRFADLSWFMGRLDEFIACKANREDDCKGHFWEKRFKCRLLLDEAALLTCMTYIDLNPIRAGETKTPEESRFTSAYDRIQSFRAQEKLDQMNQESGAGPKGRQSTNEVDRLREKQTAADWLCPLNKTDNRQGALNSVSTKEYLSLLDLVGREIVPGKKGSIPMELAPILQRLSLDKDDWLDTLNGYDSLFRRILGCAAKVIETAKVAGLAWFHGIRTCREVFG